MKQTPKQRAKNIEQICIGIESLNTKRMKLNYKIDKQIKDLLNQKNQNECEFLEAKENFIKKECKKYKIKPYTINRILN